MPPSGSGQTARLVAAAITLVVALTVALPAAALAQPGKVSPAEIQTQFQLLEYRDLNNKEVPVPPGISVKFRPFGGVIAGEAACSDYRAGYAQTPTSISIEPPEITRVPCDATAQEVDDAFYEALKGAASLSLDGDILTVYGATNLPLMRLTRATIPFDPTIAQWELARIGDPDGSIETVAGVAPTVEFLRGGGSGDRLTGRVVGTTGCGSFLGSYQTDDSSMRIVDVDYRLTECTEELARQAEGFVSALGEVTDFAVLPAGLSLMDETGATRLALSPAIVLGERRWTPTEILDANGNVLELSDKLSTSAVQFFGPKVEGITFCGRPFSGGSLSAGLALSTSQVTPAERPKCPRKNREVAQEVENAFLDSLRLTAAHALRGDELELLDRTGKALMRLAPQAELSGPTWQLVRIDPRRLGGRRDNNVAESAPFPITATFTPVSVGVVRGETGAVGRAGPITFTANFATPGAGRISIDTPRVERRGCKRRSPACVRQEHYLKLLEMATAYTVREGDLKLLQNGKVILWFNPEQPEVIEE